MKKHITWLVLSSMIVLSMLAASCAPTIQANPTTSAPTTTAPTTSSPTKTTTPTTAAPTTPAGPEMSSVSLKKLDGTTITKQVEKPKYGGEMVLARATPILAWDEAYVSHWSDGEYASPVQGDELLIADWTRGAEGTGEATWQLSMWFDINFYRGGLAESWEINPPDTIIFHIRKGVRWSLNPALEASKLVNGREITADDIVWTIKRLYFEMKSSPTYGVTGTSRPVDVYATDKYTVVVKSPPGQIWSTHEYVSAWTRMSPPEIVQKYGDAMDWTRNVGVGPFYVKDYVAMSSVTYARNPNYWQKDPLFPDNQLPYVDTVKLLIIPDSSTRLSAIRTGKIDRLTGLLWEEAREVQKTSPELKWVKWSGTATTHFAGRIDKPELPFKDVRVRRALMMAIDKQKIVDTYYGGEASIVAYPIAPTPEWTRAYVALDQLGLAPDGFDTKKVYEYHPDEARKLLADAGYPNGFKTEIVLLQSNVDLASIVKDYWAQVGVELTLDVKESGVYTTMQNRKSYSQMMLHGYTSPALPQGMWTARSGNVFNFVMVSDPKIEDYYARISEVAPRSDEWWKRLKEQSLYQMHMVYSVTTPLNRVWHFWQPWLKRYNGESELGLSQGLAWTKYAWIDQELKRSMGR